jgi:hypothetical protein
MTREQGTSGATVRYLAAMPMPQTSAPFDVIIGLTRTNGQPNAPYSKVTIAAPFAITSTVPAMIPHQSTLPLAIAPKVDASIASMRIEAIGSCVDSYNAAQSFDATGATTFDVSKLQFIGGEPPANGCDVTLRVRAESNGQVDSVFQRGALGAISAMPGLQARDAQTHLTP